MPLTNDDDIAAFAKREDAYYRTRMVGLMVTLGLVFTLLTILPTTTTTTFLFKSPISSSTSDSVSPHGLVIGRRDFLLRQLQIDECPTDPNKTKVGLCGCGVPDTDTDRDGTPDCTDLCPLDARKTTSRGLCGCNVTDTNNDTDKDGTIDCLDACPRDGNKTIPGICGCGKPETDADRDNKPDCIDDCVSNDPTILSLCDGKKPYRSCEGCAQKYYKIERDCKNYSQADYSVNHTYVELYEYINGKYVRKQHNDTINQRGALSSNDVWKKIYKCDGKCELLKNYVDGVSCAIEPKEGSNCLVCGNKQKGCNRLGDIPAINNTYFYTLIEAPNPDCL